MLFQEGKEPEMTDKQTKPKQEEQPDLELAAQDADAVRGGARPKSNKPEIHRPANFRPRTVKAGPKPL